MSCFIPEVIVDDDNIPDDVKIEYGKEMFKGMTNCFKPENKKTKEKRTKKEKNKKRYNIKYISTVQNNEKNKEKKSIKEKKKEKSTKIIWDYYKQKFDNVYNPRTFSNKRKRKIKARLKHFSVQELKQAIENIRNSDWHIGKNPNQKVYATPEFIFKNNEKIEEWLHVKDKKKQKDVQKLNEALR